MPLDPDAAGAALAAAAKGAPPGDTVAVWKAVAKALFDHIKANAQVAPGIPVATTGSPSAQTGATTAPGTIT